jgi:phosphatidylinositol dimannoside acyltransferase
MSIMKDMLLWLYWYPLRNIIQRMPVRCVYSLAKISGELLYHVLTYKRKALEKEFYSSFGIDSVDKQAKRAVRKAFINLCQTEAEMMLYPVIDNINIMKFVETKGIENLENALYSGNGVMLLFAHFGANQMIMPAIGCRGIAISQLSARPTVWPEKLPNKKFTRMGKKALEIRWAQELSLPVTHINIFGSLKGAFTCLKRNEILGIAIDGGGGKKRTEVDFLGKKALFSTGALDIALRTKCAVLPTFMIRCNTGRNKMIIEEPMDVVYSDAEDPIKINTQLFVKKLEGYVLRYPCHYLNFLALRTFMEGIDGIPFIVKKEDINEKNIAH